jgi:formamidopyrimidine-DNA glycosylase
VPELPEVETIRRALEPALVGRAFDEVEIADARLTRPFDPVVVAAELRGERVEQLDRRGKYLIVRFASGRALLIHLRMTGSLQHAPDGLPDDPYRRAVVKLDDGSDVAYRDVRRFGTWLLAEPGELEPYLAARLGDEPLETRLTARHLGNLLAKRRAPIKAAILDQRTLAGVGNIYADEALWRARIHPRRPAGSLDEAELARLVRGIRAALRVGIERQGSTLRDYRRPDGTSGEMQREFAVYGRDGEPCTRCGTPIEKIRTAGRGTWYCPRCQPL